MHSAEKGESEPGSEQLSGVLRLAGAAWAVMAAQELLLYIRPTPYGGPYVTYWPLYFLLACLFNLLAVVLASIPALLTGFAYYRRPMGATLARGMRGLQLVLLMLCVALDHADNEVMRFLGVHLTLSLLRTYEKVTAWGSDMGHILATDRGGPYLPFVILILGPATTWWAGHRIAVAPRRPTARTLGWSTGVVALLFAFSLVVYNLPSGHFRRDRVRPEVFTLAVELTADVAPGERPADFSGIVSQYHADWLAGEADSDWVFAADPDFPLVRVPRHPSADSTDRWNVIYFQLETFRGWDTGFLRPDLHTTPTPFLDSLASSPEGGYWIRNLSFGPPTVSGFLAGHCSIQPHSWRNITTSYTYTALECLPSVLRLHGWHTAFFTGSDPDWDNQTIWLDRWYDEHHFYRGADERDREVFRAAATRIRELGRSGQPFFATVVSISNHYPFRSREPALDIAPATPPDSAILNTMRYTDAVLRELVDSLRNEPWFEHTLLVVVGDHGYNLGEHDGTPGQRNGYRESVWVPLLIVGNHPRLPRGSHPDVASLLDVAPTVADLLGIQQAVPWMGHSLLLPAPPQRSFTVVRTEMSFADQGDLSLVVDPDSGGVHFYDALRDPLQRHELDRDSAPAASDLLRRAAGKQAMVDYLLEVNRVWSDRGTQPR